MTSVKYGSFYFDANATFDNSILCTMEAVPCEKNIVSSKAHRDAFIPFSLQMNDFVYINIPLLRTWAPFQYPIRRLIVRSREVSMPRDLYIEFSNRSEI